MKAKKYSMFIVIAMMVLASIATAATYKGMDYCTAACHSSMKEDYLNTLHPYKVQGPPTDTETPVLTTMIDGEEVSIFDPRTEGYNTYIAPWSDYFNEDNVIYTIGGAGWKQRFMTQVVPTTVDGENYTGISHLTDNDYAIMGMMWNKREQRWQDYHGPLGPNNWFDDGRQFGQKCGGCHTTGYNPNDHTWADSDSPHMQKGVTCESCHGPGSDHNPFADPENLNITNPSDLTFQQQFDMCGVCHGRGSSVAADGSAGQYGYPYNEGLGRGFVPGDDINDFYIQTTSSSSFWPNGNSKKHHQQYNDSLLSSHTAAEVGCIECHTSHSTENAHQTRLPGNTLCTDACHTDYADETAYRQHSAHYPETALCMDCHMPYTAKTINPFDIRSHTFKPIPPAETVAQGGDPLGYSGALDTAHVPNSCNSSCHNGVGDGPLKTNAIAQLGYVYIQSLNGTALQGDLNYDGIVDLFDVAILSGNWLQTSGK